MEGSAGFARFYEAMGSFESGEALGRLVEVLEALDGLVMLWEASALEGFGKLLTSLRGLWVIVCTSPKLREP